jgi:hypothetical protein
MAEKAALALFIGTDHQFKYPVLDEADKTKALDASAWSLSWMLKQSKDDLDAAAKVTKTTSAGIAVSGTFNVSASSNQQRVIVTIQDTDTDALEAGTYYHELKRMDAGQEAILSYGEMTIRRSVHRA